MGTRAKELLVPVLTGLLRGLRLLLVGSEGLSLSESPESSELPESSLCLAEEVFQKYLIKEDISPRTKRFPVAPPEQPQQPPPEQAVFFTIVLHFITFSCAVNNFVTLELIHPVSGNSIFQDYLDKNPAGGIQHVAYSLPVANLDKVISEFADKGFPVISSFNHLIAKIVFFDTYKEIGVMTEIMGITKEGEEQVQKMKT